MSQRKLLNVGLPLLLLGLLAIIAVFRILQIPVTHDEGITWFQFVQKPVKDIIIGGNDATANNHFLNTLLSKLSTAVFGNNPFGLRFPNLVAGILYTVFGYRGIRQFAGHQKVWTWCLLLWLILNPFLFDFWGLSRGYGLASCFVTGSVFFFLQHCRDPKAKWIWLTLLMAALAVYSNLPTLNFMVAISALLLLDCVAFQPRVYQRRLAVSLLAALAVFYAILFLLLYEPVKTLLHKKEFYYGGNTGFIHDTIGSLLRDSTGLLAPVATVIAWIVALQILFAAVWWTRALMQAPNDKQVRIGFYLTLAVLVAGFSTVVQHYLFDTLFLIDRTALFLYPLYILQLGCLLIHILPAGVISRVLSFVFTILFVVNFVLNLDLLATKTWFFDAKTTAILDRITARHQPGEKRIRMRTELLFAPSFRFYTRTSYADKFEGVEDIHSPFTPDTSYDYYLIAADNYPILAPLYTIDTGYDLGEKHLLLKRR